MQRIFNFNTINVIYFPPVTVVAVVGVSPQLHVRGDQLGQLPHQARGCARQVRSIIIFSGENNLMVCHRSLQQ